MTPLERAAEAAIAEIERGGGDYIPPYIERRSGHVVIDGEVDMRAVVRAVLLAIREPSKSMKEAGADGPLTTSHGDDESFDYVSEDDAATCWQAMIDAALGEG